MWKQTQLGPLADTPLSPRHNQAFLVVPFSAECSKSIHGNFQFISKCSPLFLWQNNLFCNSNRFARFFHNLHLASRNSFHAKLIYSSLSHVRNFPSSSHVLQQKSSGLWNGKAFSVAYREVESLTASWIQRRNKIPFALSERCDWTGDKLEELCVQMAFKHSR